MHTDKTQKIVNKAIQCTILTGHSACDVSNRHFVLLAHREDNRFRRVVLSHHPHLWYSKKGKETEKRKSKYIAE